jgi:NTP pyrophosphatase (non-canonical NTP hydrolase)
MLFPLSTKNRCKTFQGCAVDKIEEIFTITQEECGELVQVISKVRRFGMDSNRDHLIKEVGDVWCMIDLMLENNIITKEELDVAKQSKREKLTVWSKIFD